MELRQPVYSVLLVSAAEKVNAALKSLLPEAVYQPVQVAGSIGAARRELIGRGYDLVIINAPLPDDLGTQLAMDICAHTSSCVLLLAGSAIYETVAPQLSRHGVLPLQKPLSGQGMRQVMALLCATRERLRRMERKTATLEDKMAEIRLVNRAKWALISHRGMTEEEAHRWLEKQAMDTCRPRREIAEDILRNL